jgi:hypothetical protein
MPATIACEQLELIERVGQIIREKEIISLARLSRLLKQSVNALRPVLNELQQGGRVECLRPTGAESRDTFREPNHDYIFYRWKKTTDRDFLWQQDLTFYRSTPRHRRLEYFEPQRRTSSGLSFWHGLEAGIRACLAVWVS